jgi:hypothetical protein
METLKKWPHLVRIRQRIRDKIIVWPGGYRTSTVFYNTAGDTREHWKEFTKDFPGPTYESFREAFHWERRRRGLEPPPPRTLPSR